MSGKRGVSGGTQSSKRGISTRLLDQRGFKLLWADQSVSVLGSQVTVLALPLAAYMSCPPGLVGRENLVEANAKLQVSQSVAQA